MYQIDFSTPVHVYFIGIGGISMSGLAEILLEKHFKVSGSDARQSALTDMLSDRGAHIYLGQRKENITTDIDVVVYTSAIHPDNPEFIAMQELSIPSLTRAELLGEIMRNYELPVAISGTHGKTTTTSMVSEILLQADTDPTLSIGGILKSIGGNIRVGHSPYFVTEACEYTNSFLSFFPKIGIILNIEEDHLDFFKDLADVEHSFRRFAELVPIGGHVVANMDDEGARDALRGISQPIFWFSYDDPAAQCRAENVVWTDGLPSFDIYIRGSYYAHVSLRVGGKHNVMNALAAASAAYLLGVSGEAVGLGLATFTGAGRRFEYKGSFHGADVYDDYAHHPGELHALLEMAKTLPYKRIICAFQPHTYTRTKALFNDFVKELRVPDVVVLAEIYAAREQNDIGISSMDLSREIPGSVYCPTLDKVTAALARIACPGDLILTVGAGDIFKAGEKLLKEEK